MGIRIKIKMISGVVWDITDHDSLDFEECVKFILGSHNSHACFSKAGLLLRVDQIESIQQIKE